MRGPCVWCIAFVLWASSMSGCCADVGLESSQTCGAECREEHHAYGDAVAGPWDKSSLMYESLPGMTRSTSQKGYTIIAPESRVLGELSGWQGKLKAACLISPAIGAHFTMYIASTGSATDCWGEVVTHESQRLIFVLEGALRIKEKKAVLYAGGFFYNAPMEKIRVEADANTTFLVYEKLFDYLDHSDPSESFVSHVEDIAVEYLGMEQFALRRLLPTDERFDFNVHVMDFEPGEYLNIPEVSRPLRNFHRCVLSRKVRPIAPLPKTQIHLAERLSDLPTIILGVAPGRTSSSAPECFEQMHYNEHGLMMLQGKGIYRLGDDFYPVSAGDAIYIAPFVPQWFAALGKSKSRYIIYKDVNREILG